MNILIIGGNGCIGFALVQLCIKTLPECRIYATYRQIKPQFESNNLTWYQLDIQVEAEIEKLRCHIPKLDWLINCVGLLHHTQSAPEKNLSMVDPNFFLENISINTLPSLLLAKHFTPLLKASKQAKFLTISAKVGSISDNHLGGWYSYRASKAALNMVLKNIAIEWKRSIKNSLVIAFHPGTTDTPLSKPFQKNVASEKLFSPEYVATQLLALLQKTPAEQTGSFISYDGSRLPW